MGKPITHRFVLRKFGSRLATIRKSQNITQEELATRLHMHRNYIGFIERGERNPTIRTLYKITKALHIEAKELLPF